MEAFAILTCWLAVIDTVAIPPDFGPDEPTLEDVKRFPPHEVCRQQTLVASEHQQWLSTIKPVDEEHARLLAVWRKEAYWSWYVVDDTRIVTSPCTPEGARLQVLQRLKTMLGEDWWGGRVPGPIPVWHPQKP